MSKDIDALKRLIKNLRSLATRGEKEAEREKAVRDKKALEILSMYPTEEEIQEAYGYAIITDDERVRLLDALKGIDRPSQEDLSESEIYVLEVKDLISSSLSRLHSLEFDELPKEEQERILREKEERINRRRNR